MKKIKQAIKLLVFICLIVLAGLGIGLSGGVPLPLTKNRKDSEKENIELTEDQGETSESKEVQIKE